MTETITLESLFNNDYKIEGALSLEEATFNLMNSEEELTTLEQSLIALDAAEVIFEGDSVKLATFEDSKNSTLTKMVNTIKEFFIKVAEWVKSVVEKVLNFFDFNGKFLAKHKAEIDKGLKTNGAVSLSYKFHPGTLGGLNKLLDWAQNKIVGINNIDIDLNLFGKAPPERREENVNALIHEFAKLKVSRADLKDGIEGWKSQALEKVDSDSPIQLINCGIKSSAELENIIGRKPAQPWKKLSGDAKKAMSQLTSRIDLYIKMTHGYQYVISPELLKALRGMGTAVQQIVHTAFAVFSTAVSVGVKVMHAAVKAAGGKLEVGGASRYEPEFQPAGYLT
jgi:hypothetical protein